VNALIRLLVGSGLLLFSPTHVLVVPSTGPSRVGGFSLPSLLSRSKASLKLFTLFDLLPFVFGDLFAVAGFSRGPGHSPSPNRPRGSDSLLCLSHVARSRRLFSAARSERWNLVCLVVGLTRKRQVFPSLPAPPESGDLPFLFPPRQLPSPCYYVAGVLAMRKLYRLLSPILSFSFPCTHSPFSPSRFQTTVTALVFGLSIATPTLCIEVNHWLPFCS